MVWPSPAPIAVRPLAGKSLAAIIYVNRRTTHAMPPLRRRKLHEAVREREEEKEEVQEEGQEEKEEGIGVPNRILV
jgi:hypothetical protein